MRVVSWNVNGIRAGVRHGFVGFGVCGRRTTVHPRPRGEHFWIGKGTNGNIGSSPPARGTLRTTCLR